MKAIFVNRHGGPDMLEAVEVDVPYPRPGEALVEARAIAVNRPDILMRDGSYGWIPPLPFIPGIDMAGIVVGLGAATEGMAIGDRVYLSSRDLPQRGGCYVQFRAVPTHLLYKLPAEMTFESASCLAAYQVADLLLEAGQVHTETGRSVVITGSSGAVGSALLQLAVIGGSTVTAVVRGNGNRDFVTKLGATTVLEHADFLVMDALPNGLADAGFDALGGDSLAAVVRHLAHEATAVFYGSMTALDGDEILAALERSYLQCPAIRLFTMHGFDTRPEQRRAHLKALIQQIANKRVTPPVALRIPLEHAAAAHRAMETGAVTGRIILMP